MGLLADLKALCDEYLGEIAIVAAAATAIGLIATFTFPPSGVFFAAALAGCGAGIVIASITGAIWLDRQNTVEKMPVDYNKVVEDIDNLKLRATEQEAELVTLKDHQQATFLRVVNVETKIENLIEKHATDSELQTQSITNIVEGQSVLVGEVRVLRGDVGNLQGQQHNAHSFFQQPGALANLLVPHQNSEQRLGNL